MRRALSKLFKREDGSVTVEFVVLFPLVFATLLTGVDLTIQMTRQLFLDRALDLAVRDVRLGRVPAGGFEGFRNLICFHSALNPSCESTLTIEMRPMTAAGFATLDPRALCVNREEELRPVLDFNPGSGGQELMLIRVCAVNNPFITTNAWVFGSPRGPNDDFMSASIAVIVNEPT